MSHIDTCHQQKGHGGPLGFEGMAHLQSAQGRSRNGTFWHPCLYFRGLDSSPSTANLNFLLERNELISLIMLADKCNLDNLYNKPGYRVVSKACSIPKKTAAVGM
jgi:hypothetical protein